MEHRESGVLHLQDTSSYAFSYVELAYTVLAASMSLLENNLVLHISPGTWFTSSPSSLAFGEGSRITPVFSEDLWPSRFAALNPGEGYGLLRVMEPGERPNPRNVVIYEALPNELPHVAGIITTVPQTPLSHVNLRAVQDGVPNSFIPDALDNHEIDLLVGSQVYYSVTDSGYSIRAADTEEVDAHYARVPDPPSPKHPNVTSPSPASLRSATSASRTGTRSGSKQRM